jgi:hypothetical protein
MKNKLTDLNDHLFAEIERLADEKLNGDDLAQEIGRSKAICDVAMQVIAGGRLGLDAARAADQVPGISSLPLLKG